MDVEIKPQRKTGCTCDKLPLLIHELNQSLIIIQAYSEGCSQRIKKNNFEIQHLTEVFKIISDQAHIMGQLVHSLDTP